MADEPIESAATTNGAGGAPEPVAASPAPAPAAAAPEVAPVPAVEAAPAAPAVPEREPSLLETFDAEQAAKAKPAEPDKPKVEEAKPAAEGDKPKAEADKPADPVKLGAEAAPEPEKPAAPAVPEPVVYEYTLPETIKLDDTQRTELHTALDAFRADPAKGAQSLIDLHNKTMQDYANNLYGEQVRTFNDTRKGWRTQVMADEELGGAGHDTSMGAVARMRDLLLANGRTPAEAEKHRQEFDDFLKVTGAGDHPAFLRMLHSAARIFDEAPMPPPGARPPPNIGTPKGRGLRSMYKTNGQGNA